MFTGNGRIAWGQSINNDGGCENSYNLFFPYVSDNDNCKCNRRYAGCGSVAMGQIMWYWQWPFVNKYRHYEWNDIPIKLAIIITTKTIGIITKSNSLP